MTGPLVSLIDVSAAATIPDEVMKKPISVAINISGSYTGFAV
jgi:hypothetical protein